MSILLSRGDFSEGFAKLTKPPKDPLAKEIPKDASNDQETATGRMSYIYEAKSYPANGVCHNFEITHHQTRRWRDAPVLSVLPALMTIGALFYLLTLLYSFTNEDKYKVVLLIVLDIIVAALPWSKSLDYRYISEFLTAIVTMVCILQMEILLGRRQCLVTFLSFLVVGRVLYYKSFFDNFAICVAYSVNSAALNAEASLWYYVSNISLCTHFVVALLLLYVYKRLWHRVWEHIRILMILTEKQKQEDDIGKLLVSAHIPVDIQNHIFPPEGAIKAENSSRTGRSFLKTTAFRAFNKPTITAKPAENAPVSPSSGTPASPLHGNRASTTSSLNNKSNKSPLLPQEITARLFEASVDAGLLPPFSEAQLSLEQLYSIGGLDRRDCALVAISFDSTDVESGAQDTPENLSFLGLLDKLAVEHRITCVRQFGNVWIGCVGFFRTWEAQYINCYEAVLFATEASFLSNSGRVSFAVDCGSITGGYQNSLNFDLFGQEIRWLLMVIELKLHGKVVVGDAVQRLLNAHRRSFPDLLTFRLASKNINLPWRTGSDITVNYVENGAEIVDFDALKRFVINNGRVASLARAAPAEMNWTTLQNLLMQADVRLASVDTNLYSMSYSSRNNQAPYNVKNTNNNNNYNNNNNTRNASGVWEVSDSKPGLDQEIGEEFLLTATQRFQLSFDDPVLDKFTDEQLYQIHVRLENSLYQVIRRICFGGFWQRLFLWSNYRDTKGQAEYKSVMRDIEPCIFDSSGPLGVFAQLAPIWRLFLPPSVMNKPGQPPVQGPVSELELPPKSPRTEKPAPKTAVKMRSVKVARRYHHPGAIMPVLEEDQEEEEKEDEESVGGNAAGAGAGEADAQGVPVNFESSPRSSGFNLKFRTKPSAPSPAGRLSKQAGRLETKRGWQKYCGDVNLFFHNSTLNIIFVCLFYLIMLFAAHFLMIADTQRQNSSLFLCVASLHFLFIAFVERRYDNYVSLVVFALNIVAFFAISNNFVCFVFEFNVNSTTLPTFGDFNGETVLGMFVLMLVPYHMRQHCALSFMDSILMLLFASLVRYTSPLDCYKPGRYRGIVVYISVIMNAYYWALQYSAYASYFLEHKLLPNAMKNFQQQRANTRALLHAFAPSAPLTKSCELYVRKPYAQCAVTALHIKAADQISHFVEPHDLSVVLHRIHKIVEKCITECGMLSVTRFSGVYIAVACKDSAWDSVEALRFHENHTARTVVLLRNVRNRLGALSKDLRFNVQMGIGIHQGPVLMGFVGRSRFSFDVCGPVRDLAVAMASFHTDGAFANDAFDSDIRKMQAPEDLIRDVTSILDSKRSAGSRWLRIDGSFNGIQLEDFKYLCLLGQGGYGSVHLVAEKHTGAPYAIKAIELKQESKLTKMIERECSILQMVDHPNVVNLKYSFRNHNRLYLVMSYIRGGNLKQVVERDKLDLPHMVLWFAELILAVDYLHSLGIIHRDVKPANCMIGTDGHLKLADFGLSKVVTVQQDHSAAQHGESTNDELGISLMAYQKVCKFLPLKNETPAPEDKNTEVVTHRTIKILLITMDDGEADSTLLFINTTVEVVIADYDIDSDTIRQSGFEAIFIDGDYYEEDSVQLVAHFCSQLFNRLPVVLCAKDDEMRTQALQNGARACSRLPLESLVEETFDVLFGSERVDATMFDPFQKYLVDLIAYQEERAAQNEHNSQHLSMNDKGFDKNGSATVKKDESSVHSKSRNFVAVESKSHSLVGTLHFIAPEVIRLRKYGKAVDWWACGITFYECLVRKHLFAGDDKRIVFENIMNAPIVLDALLPFGDPIVALVRGLLNRDIRRRLGSQSISTIKSQKVFEKIDWTNIHTMNPLHKPAQFVNRKFRADDRDLFFGPTTDHDISLRPENLEMRNTTSMQKYLLSKKRAKMRGGNSSSRSGKASGKIGRLSTHPGNGTNGGDRTGEGHSRNERGERERGGGGGKRRSDRAGLNRQDHSRSISNSSLDYQEEVIPEQEEEEAVANQHE